MSSQAVDDPGPIIEPTRRRLTERQAQVVQGLLDAGVAEIRAEGYDGLTVRNVARRAGVAAATAYTYFSSKDHLVAEIFWRRLAALPVESVDHRRAPATRVGLALRAVGLLVADEPELSAACTTALLASDPDVKDLRDRIGADIHRRFELALGADADPAVLRALTIAYSGAMLQAGMGYLTYDDLADQLTEIASLILGGAR
jgi:AcrR family transcriptional regulator